MPMSMASELVQRWHARTGKTKVLDLAQRIDPRVRTSHVDMPLYRGALRYTFPDGSSLVAFGRGPRHQLKIDT
jgi:hypothetical protein